MPGETPERASAGRPVGDQGTSRTGASANGTGEHSTRTGEVLWRAAARVYRAPHASEKERCAESRAANGTAATVGSNRNADRTNPRVQRADREAGGERLSPSEVAEAGQGCGHTDRTD